MDEDNAIAKQVKCADNHNVVLKDAVRSAKAVEREYVLKKMGAGKEMNTSLVTKLKVQQSQITKHLNRTVTAEVHLKKKTRDVSSLAEQSEDVQQVISRYEQRCVALAGENTAFRATKAEKISLLQMALDKKTLLLEHAKNSCLWQKQHQVL